MKKKLTGEKRFPLVLMLEPLFRCNLECSGCGKIQHPIDILKRNLTPQQCFSAAKECGAPIVSIAGGEPFLHPQIDTIVNGLIERKRFVYLCTNGILLEKHLAKFQPSDYLTLNIHLDGLKAEHDLSVCREGVFDQAVAAIMLAKAKGFRVTTNTTVFEGHDPKVLADFFDFVAGLNIDGMMVSPGYSYEKAPVQDRFLNRDRTIDLFRTVFSLAKERNSKWVFNHSPFFLDFLQGKIHYECMPWGNPNYSVLGWQKPCYLLSDGYAQSFQELMSTTAWDQYGKESGNPKCQNCLVHCGHEPSAVADSTRTLPNTWRSLKSAFS